MMIPRPIPTLAFAAALASTTACATTSAEDDETGSAPPAETSATDLQAYGVQSSLDHDEPDGDAPTEAFEQSARKHLGHALKWRRIRAEHREQGAAGSSGIRTTLAKRYASLDLSSIRSAYTRAIDANPSLIVTADEDTPPLDTLAAVHDGRVFPFYQGPDAIDGFLESPDGSQVAVFFGEPPRNRNLKMETVELHLVDLATFEVRELDADRLHGSTSMRVTWGDDSQDLYIRHADSDPNIHHTTCSVDDGTCRSVDGLTPEPLVDLLERRRPGVRIGLTTSHRLEPVPRRWLRPEALGPDGGRVNPMSIRLSPDGRFASFVTIRGQHTANAHRIEESILWVKNLESGKVRRIETGTEWFHVRWLGPDRFVYEGETTEIDATQKAVDDKYEQLASEFPNSEIPESQRSHFRRRARDLANRALGGRRTQMPLLVYDLDTRTTERWLPLPKARLTAASPPKGYVPDPTQ